MKIKDYMQNTYENDQNLFIKNGNIKTGIKELDRKTGGLYPGLYVVGGSPTVGKTTLVLQIAEQVAQQGHEVLFFSLEMSALEIVTKGISRRTCMITETKKGITSLDIRKAEYISDIEKSNLLKQAQDRYISEVGEHLHIEQGDFSLTHENLKSKIEDFAKEYKDSSKVIFLDYLQIIKAGEKQAQREAIEDTVLVLKRVSRALSIPIVVVSSLNRASYNDTAGMESIKETGMIEYTADVLLFVELSVMHEDTFRGDEAKRREQIEKAKAKYPREITIKCLKNRYGISKFDIPMIYYSRYDMYYGAGEEPKESDGFVDMTAEEIKEIGKIYGKKKAV